MNGARDFKLADAEAIVVHTEKSEAFHDLGTWTRLSIHSRAMSLNWMLPDAWDRAKMASELRRLADYLEEPDKK